MLRVRAQAETATLTTNRDQFYKEIDPAWKLDGRPVGLRKN